MTLPAGMTETEQLRHNAMLMGSRHNAAHPPPSSRTQQQQQPPPPRIRYSKGVQTESTNSSVGIVGPRKVPPSLQYCRLCFQKQDLEPIFTGDQTLIEPDLIDKIFGCTEIMVSLSLLLNFGGDQSGELKVFWFVIGSRSRMYICLQRLSTLQHGNTLYTLSFNFQYFSCTATRIYSNLSCFNTKP